MVVTLTVVKAVVKIVFTPLITVGLGVVIKVVGV
jgi:hypothetical protein